MAKDPIGVIEQIYAHFGLRLSDEARKRMEMFLAANPRGKYGSHRYSLEDFGLTHEDGRLFEAYRERFRIPVESIS